MYLVYICLTIFAIVFAVFFYFVYRDEKKEYKKYAFLIAFGISTVFGLIVSIIVLLIILFLSGSLNIINGVLDLSLNQKQIIYLILWYVIFCIFIEDILMKILLFYFGNSRTSYFLNVSIIRGLFLFTIGSFLLIDFRTNVIFTISFTIFLYLLDLVINYYQNKQKNIN
ncbi:hypothetical protein [Oceanobacillus locisalsi]|uniref:Uncharacterized protein n=1 Tax=Oceanobacillus locisalsi TaxID=546107 RepID=A0ABW3NHP1_9BACI